MLHTLLYFLALFCLSTSPNWAKLNHMPVEVLGFYRLGISAVLLGLWVFLFYKKPWPRLSKNIFWVLLSGVFFFTHLWTFKFAAKNTTISNMMIIFSSNPIWSSIGAVVFFKEKLTLRLFISYMLAFASIFILVGQGFNLAPETNKGDIAAFFSAILFALYMLTGKKARVYFDNQHYSLIQYTITAILFGACIGYSGAAWSGYDDTSWWAVIGIILLPTFLGHYTMTYLVTYMNLSLMTCGKLVEPAIASLIAAAVFHETLNPHAPYAFALTILAVLVLFEPQLRNIWRFAQRAHPKS